MLSGRQREVSSRQFYHLGSLPIKQLEKLGIFKTFPFFLLTFILYSRKSTTWGSSMNCVRALFLLEWSWMKHFSSLLGKMGVGDWMTSAGHFNRFEEIA